MLTGSSQAMQQMPSNIAQETVNNLMNRADMVSFIYLDNMAKSMKRAGEVWLSMAREVYGSEREVRVVNEDGSDDVVVMSAEVKDEQTGEVIALNDLSVGRYDVIVDVGPSYGLASRVYESRPVRDALLRLRNTPRGSTAFERNLEAAHRAITATAQGAKE